MSTARTLVLICLLLAGKALPASADEDPLPGLLPGEILAETVSRLPREPLSLTGHLTIRRHRGQEQARWGFSMQLAWTDQGPRASVETRDLFGRPLERMTITRHDAPELTYSLPPDFTPTNPPPLTAGIRGSDLTWLDLTLDYLWWPNATSEGVARTKGRTCDVIRVTPPYPLPACSAALLWIDREGRLLLKAEQLDAHGRVTRRMWVESIKRFEQGGMIKDLAVARPNAPTQTRLLIDDVDTAPPRIPTP